MGEPSRKRHVRMCTETLARPENGRRPTDAVSKNGWTCNLTCTIIFCFGKGKYFLVLTGQKIIQKQNIFLFCFGFAKAKNNCAGQRVTLAQLYLSPARTIAPLRKKRSFSVAKSTPKRMLPLSTVECIYFCIERTVKKLRVMC